MVRKGLVFVSGNRSALVPPSLLHQKGLSPIDILNPNKTAGIIPLWGGWAKDPRVSEQINQWNEEGKEPAVRPGDEVVFELDPFTICEVSGYGSPEKARRRLLFSKDLERQLGFVYPRVEFPYDVTCDHTMKCCRLWAPIGRGAQVLIAGPWGSGKTWTIRRLLLSMLELASQGHPSMGKPYFIFIQTGGFERTVDLGEFRKELEDFRKRSTGDVPIEHYYGFDYGSNSNSAIMALQRSRRLVEMGYDVVFCGDSLPGIGLSLKAFSRDKSLTRSGLPMEVLARLQFEYLVAGQRVDGRGSLTPIFTALTGERGSPGGVIYQDAGGPASTVTIMHGKYPRSEYPWIDLHGTNTRRIDLMLTDERLEEHELVHDSVSSQNSASSGLARLQELAKMPREKRLSLLRSAKRTEEIHSSTRQVLDVAPSLKKVEDQVGIIRALLKAADLEILKFLMEFIQRLNKDVRAALFEKLDSMGLMPAHEGHRIPSEDYAGLIKRLIAEGILEGPLKPVYDYKIKTWRNAGITLSELEERLRAGENPDLIKKAREK